MKTKLNKQRSHTAHWRRIITECCTLNSENQSRRQKENKWSCVKASRLQIQGGQQGSERTQWTEREATEKGVKGEQQSHVPALLYLLWSLIKRAKHCGRQEEKRSFTLITIKNKTTKDELQIKRPTDEQTHMHMDTDTLICFVRVFTVVAPTLMKLPKHISWVEKLTLVDSAHIWLLNNGLESYLATFSSRGFFCYSFVWHGLKKNKKLLPVRIIWSRTVQGSWN